MAERDAALRMAERIAGEDRVTVGGDRGYDTRGFVEQMRERNVTPHVSRIGRAAARSMAVRRDMPATR